MGHSSKLKRRYEVGMATNNTSKGMSQNGNTLLLISTGIDCNQSPTSRFGSAAVIDCNTGVPMARGMIWDARMKVE
jgi:hypothetical protein